MLTINKLNESWINIQGDYDELLTLKQHFTFTVPNAKFIPKVKAGIWDGKIRLLERNGNLPIGLYPKLKYLCKKLRIPIENNFTKTSINISDKNIDDYLKEIKSDLKLREYQRDSLKAAFKQQKCIILSPTASGKSFILFLIAMLNLKINSESKILVIVPSINLVDQMQGDFCEYAENIEKPDIHKIYSGQERHNYSSITISTWQSLTLIEDETFFESFDCVLVDEVHGASNTSGSKSMGMIIQKIIGKCSNAKMKIGVSGTIQDEIINTLQLEGLFGKINEFTSTKKLMNEGFLSNLKIQFLVLKYSRTLKHNCFKKYKKYPEEMQLIREIDKRLNFIVNLSKKINNKNVLILFKNIDYGKAIYNALLNQNLDRNIHYVSGETDANDREEVRKLTSADRRFNIEFVFGKNTIEVHENEIVFLNNGQTKKAKNIDENDDVSEKWINCKIKKG